MAGDVGVSVILGRDPDVAGIFPLGVVVFEICIKISLLCSVI